MKTDLRFDENICRAMVGKEFRKYRCDVFHFSNSVYQTVGLYIGDEVYSLRNTDEYVDYFGWPDDDGVFRLGRCSDEDVRPDLVDTPIKSVIRSVKIVNDRQKICVKEDGSEFELWLTRAVIFCLENGAEVSFAKDYVPFSEQIYIRRGYDLEDALWDEKKFLEEGWDETVTAECQRETVEIG